MSLRDSHGYETVIQTLATQLLQLTNNVDGDYPLRKLYPGFREQLDKPNR